MEEPSHLIRFAVLQERRKKQGTCEHRRFDPDRALHLPTNASYSSWKRISSAIAVRFDERG